MSGTATSVQVPVGGAGRPGNPMVAANEPRRGLGADSALMALTCRSWLRPPPRCRPPRGEGGHCDTEEWRCTRELVRGRGACTSRRDQPAATADHPGPITDTFDRCAGEK